MAEIKLPMKFSKAIGLGIEDAPSDSNQYVRRGGRWVVLEVPESVDLSIIAESYSTDKTYEPGDYCIYEKLLYICDSQTTGEFDSSKWVLTSVTAELKEKSTLMDAPSDDAFYVRSNNTWIKIADATQLIIEGYPVESEEDYELVKTFNGNFYHKVSIAVEGTLTIGLWNVDALEYDKEVEMTDTNQILELGSLSPNYELHAKGNGTIVSAIAGNDFSGDVK